MHKSERQQEILDLCAEHGVITVKFVKSKLDVSDMTIRRDLDELAKKGELVRIHGGAQSKDYAEKNNQKTNQGASLKYSAEEDAPHELSHIDKLAISVSEKRQAAQNAASVVETGDTIFLGVGTTVEMICDYLKADYLRVITNSDTVFNLLKEKENIDIYLIGGFYRRRTGAFVGSMANDMIAKIGIQKAFVGVNGIEDANVYTFSMEEGKFQQLVLDKASKRYLVADSHKLGRNDFYNFYSLSHIDALFTDQAIDPQTKHYYEQFTKVIDEPIKGGKEE